MPVTKNGKLVGILTNRDLRFETRYDVPMSSVMTKENLITVGVGTTLEEAEAILHQHRVEKLLVVDEHYNLKGLITVKDTRRNSNIPMPPKMPKDVCVWRGARYFGRFSRTGPRTGEPESGSAGGRFRPWPQ